MSASDQGTGASEEWTVGARLSQTQISAPDLCRLSVPYRKSHQVATLFSQWLVGSTLTLGDAGSWPQTEMSLHGKWEPFDLVPATPGTQVST